MKIVNRTQFLALPAQTLFSKYEPCCFGELEIKSDSLRNDWLTQDIAGAIANNGSEDFASKLFDAEINGTSLPMDFDCLGRDGCFDEGQLFAVWEKADVEALIGRLIRCL